MAQAARHPPCAAVNRSGKRCKNDALPGRLFCAHHELGAEASPRCAAAAGAVREHREIFGEGRQEKG
jgi:hypothetical protein